MSIAPRSSTSRRLAAAYAVGVLLVAQVAAAQMQPELEPVLVDTDAEPDSVPALGWRYSGIVGLTMGGQRSSAESIYDHQGSPDKLSWVGARINVILRASQPNRVALLFDGQAERLFETDTRERRVNQFNAAFDLTQSLKLRLGKQRVLWGRGFTYIPTDFVNPPLDPTGLDIAKVGVPAVSLDYVNDYFLLTTLVRRETKSKVDSLGVKVTSSAISGLDLDAVAYRAPSIGEAVGASFALDAGQRLHDVLNGLILSGGVAMHRRSRYPQSVTVSENGVDYLLPGDIGAEGPYTSWMLAGTHEFSDRFSVTAEIYRIGDAYSRTEYQHIIDCLADRAAPCSDGSAAWLNYLAYGRNQQRYLTAAANLSAVTEGVRRLTDTLGIELSVLYAPGDNSSLRTLTFRSNYWDQAEIVWRIIVPTGGPRTEFGTVPYRWYSELAVFVSF
jgi:hypothetical protein